MSAIAQQALKMMNILDEPSQISVLKFIEYLAAKKEEEEDLALYDEAKAADDGYYITEEDLRAKYGLQNKI